MFKKARIIGASSLLAFCMCFPCAVSAHGDPGDPIVVSRLTKTLADLPGKEVLVLTVEYPPGGADPVHRHDAHGIIYVLEGEIVMGVRGGQPVTLRAGDTFYESPDDVHTIGRNASKTMPAKFVVVLVKDAGRAAFVPIK